GPRDARRRSRRDRVAASAPGAQALGGGGAASRRPDPAVRRAHAAADARAHEPPSRLQRLCRTDPFATIRYVAMFGLGTLARVARELRADLTAAQERDPAARDLGRAEILLTYGGVQ